MCGHTLPSTRTGLHTAATKMLTIVQSQSNDNKSAYRKEAIR